MAGRGHHAGPADAPGWMTGARVEVLRVDVTDRAPPDAAVDATSAALDEIDVADAGYGHHGPIEGATEDRMHRQFDVFGMAGTTEAVMPHMRERRGGSIPVTSTIGAGSACRSRRSTCPPGTPSRT